MTSAQNDSGRPTRCHGFIHYLYDLNVFRDTTRTIGFFMPAPGMQVRGSLPRGYTTQRVVSGVSAAVDPTGWCTSFWREG